MDRYGLYPIIFQKVFYAKGTCVKWMSLRQLYYLTALPWWVD
jgi:hypothetical protein